MACCLDLAKADQEPVSCKSWVKESVVLAPSSAVTKRHSHFSLSKHFHPDSLDVTPGQKRKSSKEARLSLIPASLSQGFTLSPGHGTSMRNATS